jgi:hypothetical protein
MKPYKWTIIGAGAAGIAAVAKLLDLKINGETILWIDPDFQGGDLGKLWRNVSSNTTVARFLEYFNYYDAFQWPTIANNLALSNLPINETCQLTHTADALVSTSKVLQQKVATAYDWVDTLTRNEDGSWTIQTKKTSYESESIVLAQGALPKALDFPNSPEMLAFAEAIDATRLKTHFDKNHVYGVFGASHSAIIILENLINLGAKKVINFYKHPCKYAVDMGDWILYDDTGLKGKAADWAKKNIEGAIPKNLQRFTSSNANIETYLPQCDRVIYATGFQRRDSIKIQGADIHHYDNTTGLIAPGLYGYGIAYPEKYLTPINEIEYHVGLSKFAKYIDKAELG